MYLLCDTGIVHKRRDCSACHLSAKSQGVFHGKKCSLLSPIMASQLPRPCLLTPIQRESNSSSNQVVGYSNLSKKLLLFPLTALALVKMLSSIILSLVNDCVWSELDSWRERKYSLGCCRGHSCEGGKDAQPPTICSSCRDKLIKFAGLTFSELLPSCNTPSFLLSGKN